MVCSAPLRGYHAVRRAGIRQEGEDHEDSSVCVLFVVLLALLPSGGTRRRWTRSGIASPTRSSLLSR